MENLLEIANLSITAGKQLLVDNVSLHLAIGEVLAIVGESGSGKTLTAKALVDTLPKGITAQHENYQLLGNNMRQLSMEEKSSLIGKEIGFIPQNTGAFLHPLLKIKNQITDAYCYHRQQSKKQGYLKAQEMLANVGFDDPERVLNAYPWELSGGMKQRINIAMAMMLDPQLLIADEPTTALDCVIQKQVIALLQHINQEKNIGIIFISHDLRLVKYFAHRILVMSQGKIVETGYTEQIFNFPQHDYTKLLLKAIPKITG